MKILTTDEAKARVSKLLWNVIHGDPRYLFQDGQFQNTRWGTVEKDLHTIIDDLTTDTTTLVP